MKITLQQLLGTIDPLPLVITSNSHGGGLLIKPDGLHQCTAEMDKTPQMVGNAALYIHAVNNLEPLVKALENAANVIALALNNKVWSDKSTDEQDSTDEIESVLNAAREVLSNANIVEIHEHPNQSTSDPRNP